ncbi:hypothetical protein ACTMTI_11025 [Nonomuraea sp. H19]
MKLQRLDNGVQAEHGRVFRIDPRRCPDDVVRAELGKGAQQ